MNDIYGIDCGLDGYITQINNNGAIIGSTPMPVRAKGKGREIDILSLDDILSNVNEWNDPTFIVEDPGGHAPSAAGLRSMTRSFSIIEALLVVKRLKYHLVTAQKWQKEFWSKPKMPKGQKFNTKAEAFNQACKIWPEQDWTKTERSTKPHDGMIDSALIAEYGRRKF